MKKILLVLSFAAAFAGLPACAFAGPAADPQTTAAVKAMLDAMETRKTMVATYAQMEAAMPTMMKSQIASMIAADTTLNPEQKRQAQAKLDRAMGGMLKAMSAIFKDPALIDEMIDEMVPLYANNFTAAEINELAAFYRTPIGRKMMASVPKIAAESMAISQRVVMPRMGKLMQDMMQELQKP
jgi:hypothetical protein